MPIEVKELHIKTVISDSGQQNAPSNGGNTENASSNSKMDKIIEMCVEQVLEILKEKKER